jgi:hypothetical protein
MRIIIISVSLLLAILLGGCVPSLHPLYTTSDLVMDTTIIGTWVNDSGNEEWEFSISDNSSYGLFYTEEKSPAHFQAYLIKLDTLLLMDTYPDQDIDNDFFKLHLVPAHIFGRIWITQDTLRMAMLDSDWLQKMIAKNKIKIANEALDGGIVLTAPTADLQKLMQTYGNRPEAFSSMTVLHRQRH